MRLVADTPARGRQTNQNGKSQCGKAATKAMKNSRE
jgi:hypothetical protein